MTVSTSIYEQATADDIKTYLGTDEKVDSFPSTDTQKHVRAQDFNRIISGLADVAQRTRYGMVCQSLWSHPNVTASQTAASLYRAGGGDTALIKTVAPWDGFLIGLGVWCENACTAGTLTINVEVNGTPLTLSVGLESVTNTQSNYTSQDTETADDASDIFSAGDLIEVTFTTNGSWAAGSTPSVGVDLYLAMGE